MKSKRSWVAINRLKTKKTFGSIFPRDEKMVDAIADHMAANGYDQSQPIVVWDRTEEEDKNALYIVDGHTRKCAAAQAGISPLYVARVKFPSEEAALEYAIHNQRDRRNMTEGDLFRYIQAVDSRKPRGGDRKSEAAKSKAQGCANDTGKSAQQMALIFGVKQRQVEKVRTIIDHADEQTKKDVESGKKRINKAYNETQQKRREQKTSGKQKTAGGNPQSIDPVFEEIHTEATRHLSDILELALSASDRKGWKAYKNILFNAVHDTEIKIERIK